MRYTFSEINDATGFANGDMFENEEQVREYFKLENYDAWVEAGLTQDELDAMAETVIENGWHMKPTYRGRCIMVNRSQSGTYNIPGAAEMESWDEVRAEADSVERVDALIGWGPWNAVYRIVDGDGDELWYFVREED